MRVSSQTPEAGPFDRAPFSAFQFWVVAVCGLVAMLDGFDTQSIGYAAPRIADDWNIASSAFGPIFSAGLIGVGAGALVFGPIADKIGRKPVILLATAAFGLFALLTSVASSLEHLLILRFITGLGLGAALPNLIALTSEYAPARLRATAVMIMICGFPLGSTIGGLISAPLMDAFGWRSVFVMGGAAPLVLLPVLIFFLPESARFLANKGAAEERIRRILHRIAPDILVSEFVREVRAEHLTAPKGLTVPRLFTDGRAPTTLLLWLTFFNSLLVYYFLASWLPTLIRDAGLPLDVAIYAAAIMNFGGVAGAIFLSRLLEKHSPFVVLGCTYAAAAVFVVLVALSSVNAPMLLVAAFLAGFASSGAATGSNALAAALYPTAIRSTGVGWALGIGRAGAIAGPLVAGVLLGMQWTPKAIIMTAAAPAVAASVAVLLLGFVRRKL